MYKHTCMVCLQFNLLTYMVFLQNVQIHMYGVFTKCTNTHVWCVYDMYKYKRCAYKMYKYIQTENLLFAHLR